MAEVLDSRPVSNLELLGGRFLGTLGMAMLPPLVLAGLVQLIGLASGLFGWP